VPPILRRSLPRRSFLLLAAAGLLACACASSTKSEASGEPQRIRLVTYTNPREFELVNTSHTGRVEQYSTKLERSKANRKVQSDEVMSALIEWMDDNGFQRLSRPGHAPSAAVQGVTWALEIERAKGTAHVLLTTSMPPADVKDCVQLKNGFLELFNSTYGLQAVETKPGEVPFKTPDRKSRR
jgi:hypothetical protein